MDIVSSGQRIPPNVTLWFKYDEAALAELREMWWLLAVVGFLCVCFPCCLFKPWAMCSRTIIANNQMCCSLSVSLTKGCDWLTVMHPWVSWAYLPQTTKYNCCCYSVALLFVVASFLLDRSPRPRPRSCHYCFLWHILFLLRNQKNRIQKWKCFQSIPKWKWKQLSTTHYCFCSTFVIPIVFCLFCSLFMQLLRKIPEQIKNRWQALPNA